MSLYKRGGVYWFNFVFNGKHIQQSTKQGNARVARQIEAAYKTKLAMGEVGIEERKPAPTLREFAPRFKAAMEVHCAGKLRTLKFWIEKLDRLLEFEPLASSRLDCIDESLIESFIQYRHSGLAPATVNREIATLRRLMRLAYEWKVINRLPRFRMLPGERNRDFVLTYQQERDYLKAASQPLHDVALLLLNSGLRVGEALALEWRDVHLEPANGARYGYLHIRDGKTKYARRNVSLTASVKEMLLNRSLESKSSLVFPGETSKPFLVTSLDHQHVKVRRLLQMPKDFVIHSLRHTMLTRLGEAGADAFTIMRVAGHSSVTVSQRYIHPTPEGLERAFERLEDMNKRAGENMPSGKESLQSSLHSTGKSL